MSLVALMLLSLLAGPAFALPIDLTVGLGDYDLYGGYGLGGWYGGWPGLASDVLDVGYPGSYGTDFAFGGYPRTVDYSKENYVRGNYFGGTEVGTRDEVTVRPSFVRAPYSRFYSSYFPYNYYRGFGRYPFYRDPFYLPRASLLGRVAGDTTYLRR